MVRRALVLVGAVLLLSPLGCQSQLPKAWSFSEIRSHAERLDTEFGWFHANIKDIVFGIDVYEPEVIWNYYDD